MRHLFCVLISMAVIFGGQLLISEEIAKHLEIKPSSDNSLKVDKDWYKDAIFYHIWVRAFSDSDGDGYGDLKGIIQKLDYLNDGNPDTKTDLGIDAIWLSPIFESYNKGRTMHAYDTIDHYKINEKFGSNEDMDTLLKEAHKRGIKVIFDYIPNHISSFHPWFLDSVSGGNKKDWFIWNDNPDKNFTIPWGGGKWTDVWNRVVKNNSYFYGSFHRSMPDINFDNPAARAAIENVLIYWLNRGFDGARVDAARYIFEDGPAKQADVDKTLIFFTDMRKNIIDKYGSSGYNKMMVGEVWTSENIIKKYYGNGTDRFNMCFDFPLANHIRNAVYAGEKSTLKVKELSNYIVEQLKSYPDGYRNASFLNNHDNVVSRPMSDYKSEAKSILAFALNVLLPGTPFVYYGNEVGMENGPGDGDLRFRTDMEWGRVDTSNKNRDSILSWYRYLIEARNSSPAVQRGDYKDIKTNDTKILAFTRTYKDDTILVVVNFKSVVSDVKLDFTDSLVKESKLVLNIGNLYDGNSDNTGENYKNFSVNKMPPYSFRVYSFNQKSKIIAKDYLTN